MLDLRLNLTPEVVVVIVDFAEQKILDVPIYIQPIAAVKMIGARSHIIW